MRDFETWPQILDRQAMEKAEALASLRDAGLTQANAARRLEMTPQTLKQFITRNGIPWTRPQQGQRT